MKLKISLKQVMTIVGVIETLLFVTIIIFLNKIPTPLSGVNNKAEISDGYHANIVNETKNNENFRRVLFTGKTSQLVVMNILPGGEIGEEIHKYAEQTLFFLSGTGEAVINGKTFPVVPGDVVVVPAGTKHNFLNTGNQDLKIYTMYAPPDHIDGRVHKTKADADADTADEAVGEKAPACVE